MISYVWKIHFELESLLIALEIDLETKRTSGRNEVILENLRVDIWSRGRTCSLKCSREHCFDHPSNNSYFLVIELF
jgi:hypothetical protein